MLIFGVSFSVLLMLNVLKDCIRFFEIILIDWGVLLIFIVKLVVFWLMWFWCILIICIVLMLVLLIFGVLFCGVCVCIDSVSVSGDNVNKWVSFMVFLDFSCCVVWWFIFCM